jgi:hypothetical protein
MPLTSLLDKGPIINLIPLATRDCTLAKATSGFVSVSSNSTTTVRSGLKVLNQAFISSLANSIATL